MSAPALPVRRTADGETGSNLFNIRVVPVIFVPGVMGSRLSIPGGINWDPDSAGGMLRMSSSALPTKVAALSVQSRPVVNTITSPSSAARTSISANRQLAGIAAALQSDLLTTYTARGWGTVAWGFYGDILMQLETGLNIAAQNILLMPNPVYAFGYDWRRSNADSATQLLTFIDQVLARHAGATQVIIVTHSMGGLVARTAMALNPGVMQTIVGVVHGAQPSNGAVVAYRRFLTGATTQTDPALSGGFLGRVSASVLNRIMGTTPLDYATLQAGLPGPMQLLPNHLYHKFDDRGTWLQTSMALNLDGVFAVYAAPTRPPGIMLSALPTLDLSVLGINAQIGLRLMEAGGLHALVGTTAHPNTHVLFSTGVVTDVAVDLTTNTIVMDKQPLGDGTVPAVSGQCPHLPASSVKTRLQFTGLEHAAVFADPGFIAATVTIVRGMMLFQF